MPLIVEAVIGSLKSAVIAVVIDIPVAPDAGDREEITGGKISSARKATNTAPLRTDAERVAVPLPVLPILVLMPQAAPTETRFVVSWTSYNSVSAPGELEVLQLLVFQVTLLPPVEPTAWPR